MKIELVNEQSYKVLVEWWKGHSWPIIPFNSLPKTGIIVDNTVAGFLYSTDSNVCMLEWVISNPKSEKLHRKECLDILFNELLSIAKNKGFEFCFTFVQNKGLIQSLEKNNFKKTDDNMVHFIRSL